MAEVASLDLPGASGCVRVDCVPGTRFVVDVERGAVLRLRGGWTPRAPLDGHWWLGSVLVDDVTGALTVRVGARARWHLAPDLFIITGPIVRITMGRSPALSGLLAPSVRWPSPVPV